ncbi:MAG TPA: SDR family oxidoreductase [Candidatus Sulfotelmatobacter sp.]|nr:SDR family oxidoreductase [Candidatus Sulfotelmatobacter sp.]
MPPLNLQTAVITGASSGIGAAIALCLAEEGTKLHLIGRNADALGAVAQRARTRSPRVLTYRADLNVDEDLAKLQADLKRDCDRMDILVHSAGVIAMGPVETASLADFDRQYRTNVRAPYALTQALLPMLRAQQGAVVFVNSSAGMNTRACISQYSATKHALKAVADGFRAEVNADGIRVLTVYPGRTASPQQAAIHQAEGKTYSPELLMQPEDVARIILDALKVNRTAEVTDINIRPMRKT